MLKFHPTFPGRFGGVLDARGWAQMFFHGYTFEHHHTSLGLMTPVAMHSGLAGYLRWQQQQVPAQADAVCPKRFVKGLPQPPALPEAVWLSTRRSRRESEA